MIAEIVRTLTEYLRENWPELVWIALAAFGASYLAARRGRRQWSRQEFLDRLNVSLNSVEDGTLLIRTILETNGEDVFLNRHAVKQLLAAAKRTTEADPIIPIPDADAWFYLNAVLNEVSERFALGQLRRDAGLSVQRERYVLCLTCEVAGAMKTRKIRAMMIRKELLTALPKEPPKFEAPTHETRWHTLHVLAREFEKNPARFLEMEICL